MEKAKVHTHLVPVGFKSNKLIASLKQFPVHKIVLMIHAGDHEDERVMTAVKDIEHAFKGFDVMTFLIEREAVLYSSLQILSLIEKEVKAGSTVKINISGGMRNVGIAAYIASLVSGIPIYSDIPGYKDGTYYLEGILDIPLIPIKELAKEQMVLLEKLGDGVDSVDELISRLKPELEKGTVDFGNERSRLSHHIRKLSADGFIETQKNSKNLVIEKSKLGEIYLKGSEIKKLSNKER